MGCSCTGLRRVAIDPVGRASWMISLECNTGVMARDAGADVQLRGPRILPAYNGMVRTAPGAACSSRRPVLLRLDDPGRPAPVVSHGQGIGTHLVNGGEDLLHGFAAADLEPGAGWLRPRVSRTRPWSRAVRASGGAAAPVSPRLRGGSTVTVRSSAPVAAASR